MSAWSSDPDNPVLDLATLRFAVANDGASLRAALEDTRVNVISGDVVLDAAGEVVMRSLSATGSSTSFSWGASLFSFFLTGAPPAPAPALTLDAWARAGAGAGRGLRVAICEWRALAPTLVILKTVPGAGWLTPEEDGWEAVLAAEAAADLTEAAAGTAAGAGAGAAVLKPGAGMLPLLRVPQRGALCGVPTLIVAAEPLTGPHGPHAGEVAPPALFNAAGAPVSPAAQVAAARAFLRAVSEALPLALVALGWTTAARAEGGGAAGGSRGLFYNEACIDLMEAACRDAAIEGTRIALPLRASYVRETLAQGLLSRLLSGVPGASLLVWSPVPLPVDEIAWLRKALPKEMTAWALPTGTGVCVCDTIKEAVDEGDELLVKANALAAASLPLRQRHHHLLSSLPPRTLFIALAAMASGVITTAAALVILQRLRR